MRDIFVVSWWDTQKDYKYEGAKHTYLCDRNSAFRLWFLLTKSGFVHVEVRNLQGELQNLKDGLAGMWP